MQNKLLQYADNLIKEVYALQTSVVNEVDRDIPYAYQLESPKNNKITQEEYSLWIHHSCGMACVKMVLRAEGKRNIYVSDLITKALKYKLYKVHPEEEDLKKKVEGMSYTTFPEFLTKEFGMQSEVARILSIRRIKVEISKGNYVLVSVNPEIRDPLKKTLRKPGGHLVVITGFNKGKNTITIHNPSGLKGYSRKRHTLSISKFKKYFAHRGLIIHTNNTHEK